MKTETSEGLIALTRLESFEKRVKEAQKILSACERQLAEERTAYASVRPLTESELNQLIERSLSGGALCCHEGLVWLREILPEPWAQAINEWAYEKLGCHQPSEEERSEYADKIRCLQLNRFPGSY